MNPLLGERKVEGSADQSRKQSTVADVDNDPVVLYEELRLIERNEIEIRKCWRNVFLALFGLIFIFGAICTFCINLLLHSFDEQCVLFPKIQSLTEQRQSIIYDYIPGKTVMPNLPVDFVNSQWKDPKTCYLPKFVPLFSAICGLIWTAMFWMCSSDYQVLSGLQHPYRVFPSIFIFSSIMAGLCMHTSTNTLSGLWELCDKLSDVFGKTKCSYAMSLLALSFDKASDSVFETVVATVVTSWLSTICWILVAITVMIRVILVVDFTLVRVTVELRGDANTLLELNEHELRTIFPVDDINAPSTSQTNETSTGTPNILQKTEKPGPSKSETPKNIPKEVDAAETPPQGYMSSVSNRMSFIPDTLWDFTERLGITATPPPSPERVSITTQTQSKPEDEKKVRLNTAVLQYEEKPSTSDKSEETEEKQKPEKPPPKK